MFDPHRTPALAEVIAAFQDRLEAAGLGRPASIIADGQIHRFKTPEDQGGEAAGWYVLYADSHPAGAFGSWRGDISETFSGLPGRVPTPAEQRELAERLERIRRERAQWRARQADAAAATAAKLWAGARPARADNAYLARKGVGAFGVRETADGRLLVPMRDSAGALRGVQIIHADGTKRFLSGCAKKGCYCRIDGDNSALYVCEGYATGASLHMATGATVAVALDAGNLAPVALALRAARPRARLVLAADNDRWTKRGQESWNVGLALAGQAAARAGAVVVRPEFRDVSTRPTDFNDLHALEGLAEVRAQARPESFGPCLAEWGVERFVGAAPAARWLVEETLPLGAPCLLAAAGGTGKGLLALDLALSVAGGTGADAAGAPPAEAGVSGAGQPGAGQAGAAFVRPGSAEGAELPVPVAAVTGGGKSNCDFAPPAPLWLGRRVIGHGTAVILTAEDSRDAIHQRLAGLDPDGTRRASAAGRLFIVPLPNAGGPIQLVAALGAGRGYAATPAFDALARQLRRLSGVRLISIDPLASFVGVDVNADPQAGAFTQGLLARLAEETGACVLVAHHMSKLGKSAEWGAETARNAIRGTSALVDGVRLALAVWPAPAETAKKVRAALPQSCVMDRQGVFEAAVVKANAPADTVPRLLARDRQNGLLICVDALLAARSAPALSGLLAAAVREAAAQGHPFSKSRAAGLYARREELPEALRAVGRNRLEEMAQELLDRGVLVGCTYRRSQARFLDVPGGPFAEGTGELEPGWRFRCAARPAHPDGGTV